MSSEPESRSLQLLRAMRAGIKDMRADMATKTDLFAYLQNRAFSGQL